ncbi:ABC transporter permease [Leuconostoc pseudomesenteroides]|jgi:ABC-2 type transport system permease protein|uniref:ABC transporter permease n=1 Tax=Leuconostoc pseudomesenteroides TaxID=33968 RepID=UPI0011DE1AB8|nr:ABC transporter permease [Leuconostoc pseudomesenteroides]MBS0958773.1 ABC transporter permease [Leuconostoc pseudomesenteroides]MCT4380861.1 hypothetical protein [Leuconostoc pseudomesenteroides]
MLKIDLLSLPYFRNWRTFVVSFVITPVLEILMIGLLRAQFSSIAAIKSVVAISLMTAVGTLLGSLSALFVNDQVRGVALEMAVVSPYSIKYWTSKFTAALIVALGQVIITLFLVTIVTRDTSWISRAALVLPLLLIYGEIIAFVAIIISWQHDDPYLAANILGTVIILLSGVIVPVSLYPKWLAFLTQCLPFSQTMQWFLTGSGNLFLDSIVAGIWLLLGIIMYHYQIKRVKRHAMIQ